jgi:Flp pilus assembly protein TadG
MAALRVRALKIRGGSDSGAELIELAIVLPILLIVVAGIVDFGFLFQRFETVTNAAREGARLAVLPDYTDADVQERVKQYLESSGLNRAQSVVPTPGRSAITLASGASVDVVTVQVFYPAQMSGLASFLQLVGGSHASSIMLKGTSTMRTENAASGS